MLLTSDYIDPVTLTGYGRAALADQEQNQFTLSRFLPSRTIDDLQYRFTRGGLGLADSATVRAYDAESPIGKRPSLGQVTGELPPISQKIRLSEYDRLRVRRSNDGIVNAIYNDAEAMVKSVAARVELARGEALYKGKIQLNENGVIVDIDFGRAAGHTVTAGTAWTDFTNATPLTDLLAWMATYRAANGISPGVILTSPRVVMLMMQNAQMRGILYPGSSGPNIVSQDAVNAGLAAFGLPQVITYEAQVNVNGVATAVIPDDRLILLPPVGSEELGATLWGTTSESLEPEYNLAGDEPGIVVGSYSTKDPVAVWTKAAAVSLPVLANPNLSFAADVA